MSDSTWWHRRCDCNQLQHSQSSTARYRSVQLLYVLSLVIVTSTLYLIYWSGPFNNALHNTVTRSEPAVVSVVQRVVQFRHHINDTDVAATTIHPSKAVLPGTTTTVASTPQSPPTPTDTLDVDKYIGSHFADGRRLGNQMFNLAVVVYVAKLTGRQPAIQKVNYKIGLDKVFDLRIKRLDNFYPCYVFGEKKSLTYDRRVEELANGSVARGKSIFLSGFFQSWKYTQNVERRLRHHFTFLPAIRQFVDKFLEDSRPPGWLGGFVRVGVHVRRGDVLNAGLVKFGHRTPDERYFANAMRYFVDRFERIQFIVASNDIVWCRQKLADLWTTLRHRVNVTFVTPRSAGKDFAVVASCEHVIMSTGTYSWWAAWLARGVTIYYAGWPRNGTALADMFNREDYFPPTWIGMT